MSKVLREHKLHRPNWNYLGEVKNTNTNLTQLLEMIESTRNAVEQVRDSQMQQCDVAHAIKDIAKTLRRIDRRLAKKVAL